MSCIQNETILENLWDEVCEEFPTLNPEDREKICYQRFEDMSQKMIQSSFYSLALLTL